MMVNFAKMPLAREQQGSCDNSRAVLVSCSFQSNTLDLDEFPSERFNNKLCIYIYTSFSGKCICGCRDKFRSSFAFELKQFRQVSHRRRFTELRFKTTGSRKRSLLATTNIEICGSFMLKRNIIGQSSTSIQIPSLSLDPSRQSPLIVGVAVERIHVLRT